MVAEQTLGVPIQTPAQAAAAAAASGLNSAQLAAVKSGTPLASTAAGQETAFANLGNGGNSSPAPTQTPVSQTPAPQVLTPPPPVAPTTLPVSSGGGSGGYNTSATYTASDAQGQFTYQVDANGNVINKQRAPGASGTNPDPEYAASVAALAPGANPTEDEFFSALKTQLQPVLDSINGAEAAAETAANVDATQQTSAMNFQNNAQGTAGSAEASGAAAQIDQSKAAAIAQAKQAQSTALSTAYQFLSSNAYTEYKDALTDNENKASAYKTQMDTQAQTVIANLFSTGSSPDSLMQSNPLEYQTLLQYFNGDANAMNAAYVAAAQKNLINNGSPIFTSGSQSVYGQMITNPDGTPGVKYTTVNLPPGLPQNYKVTSYSQAANGQIAYVAFPVDSNGNQTVDPSKPNNGVISGFLSSNGTPGGTGDPNAGSSPDPTSTAITAQTGLSINAFNFLTQGTTALSRMSTAQREEVQGEAQTWANTNGIDLSTFQSEYTAYNTTLANNVSRFNNTVVAEGEVNGSLTNLSSTIDEADLSSIKPAAVADLFAKGQTNDSTVAKYSFYLNDLRNSLAYFYAAQQGKSSPDVTDNDDAANVITNGLGAGTAEGLQEAVQSTTVKMRGVLSDAITASQQNVWNLFGVGQNYDSAHADTTSGGSGTTTSLEPAGTTITYQGQVYTVGADGNTLTPVAGQ